MKVHHKDYTLGQLVEIADLKFTSEEMDGNEVSIQNWLGELLCRVWMEKDEFSGKRAFGNSDWEYEIYNVLIQEGVVAGSVSEYGEVEISYEERTKADQIIIEVICEFMA